MSQFKYIGIDLGTSNSAIANSEDGIPTVQPIKQAIDDNSTDLLHSLPSVIHLKDGGDKIFGPLALELGSLSPQNNIRSAKSWLCHSAIDRTEDILPWQSSHTNKMSPIAVSAEILRYLVNHSSVEKQDAVTITLTVPASFDELARKLTLEAAAQANLGKLTLLEEPLAALYSWLAQEQENLEDFLTPGDLVLVCDIGGGTTDFSLVTIAEQDGEFKLDRVAVGPHLLLGGDNIDLALAYAIKVELESDGHQIDEWQLQSLLFQARKAKEHLLSGEHESYRFSIASKGSDLFASAIAKSIDREWVENIVVNGFFPLVPLDDHPEDAISGIQEFGLPYANDPVISKHLASFLNRAVNKIDLLDYKDQLESRVDRERNLLLPNKILFNGGTVKPEAIRNRILQNLKEWTQQEIVELISADKDSAVAKGAAYYSQLKSEEKGIRIKSGTTQSLYLAVESGQMPIPGFKPPQSAVCIVPLGTHEGDILRLPKRTFALRTGSQMRFNFYASRNRPEDQLGTEIRDADKRLEESFPLYATIPPSKEQETTIPVTLGAHLNELGILEVYMERQGSHQKWQLEINTREL